MEEANKLIGTGKKHLVMGKVVDAVSALQEACGMLAKKYGDTADECGEAFFWYGKSLLDLARMENSVLGNALEGVPEEDEDENKPKDSNVESAENLDEKTRDDLRVQVYDAMAEKKDEKADGKQSEDTEKAEAGDEQEKAEKGEGDEGKAEVNGTKPHEGEDKKEKEIEQEEESAKKEGKTVEKEEESAETKEESAKKEEESAETKEESAEMEADSTEKEELADKQEEADGEEEAEEDDDAEEQGEGDGTAEGKDSDDEDVGNLQLAWEMLEVAKVIYKRKDAKEDQLMAAQAHLKLGEVSAESGNYTQALDDFQECLKLQLKHLDSDSRLLAETHYQLGVTYSLNLQYSKAIEALSSSITVIKSRLDKLQQMLDKAEGPDALPDERKELEELKALLPEIQEKVEDATEGMKTASSAAEAMNGVLDGASSSSAFPEQNKPSSSSSETKVASTNGVGSTNGHASTAPVSDISHLVRKKRKPEESPVKEGVVKKVKQDNGHEGQETQTNGDHKTSGDAASMEVESQ
ncbi:histone-binding protein N1/N2-like isoform X2 [Parambassis ranga]|uniref:Histone-binding protein N1/N2-like isoform X2 n=1 Tax=Parambassis ranga TaxID=210632 RepID=A0A6P7K7E4_9TELE|nr:histone-binding protein N1/N2-like isoform X2 [Parambassis ranga]